MHIFFPYSWITYWNLALNKQMARHLAAPLAHIFFIFNKKNETTEVTVCTLVFNIAKLIS